VVVGLGVNVTLGNAMREFISAGGNQPADLAELSPGREPPPREALVAALLEQNIALLQDFASAGFASVRDEYMAADALRDRAVQVLGGGTGLASGIARGVDAQGALLVERDGRLHGIVAGEVSVRPDEES
jgi:BirA family biotin operon repressor/biotin-[acetyl-CoA-carboxylase] ligase